MMRGALLVACLLAAALAWPQAPGPRTADYVEQAEHYRQQGRIAEAGHSLAQVDGGSIDDLSLRARYFRELALQARVRGDGDSALEHAHTALDAARRSGSASLTAVLFNDLGILSAEFADRAPEGEGLPARAAAFFEQALNVAGGAPDITATAALNRAQLALRDRDLADLERFLDRAVGAVKGVENARRASVTRLGIGAVYRDAQKQLGLPVDWRLRAFRQFDAALNLAIAAADPRQQSWAMGWIGGLYADELRYEASLDYARRAAFLAQAASDDDALYRWQWQAAQALRAQGAIEAAIVAYRQSIETLNRLKPDLAQGPGPGFRERAAPVFFDYADMLLTRTAGLADAGAVESNLREVRATLEQVKVAEVQDYFQDQCVATDEHTELDRIGGTAAIIYPILLPDRTELLVSLPGALRQFTSPVTSRQLTDAVRQVRQHIETYDGRTGYMRYAQRLYHWLIGPVEDALVEAAVDTLVIVPDGPLRTIPLAALHDGRGFLIERWAVATTPGLTLTSPRPLERDTVRLLAGGLTEAVQGFSALPNVAAELESISQEFPTRTIRDQAFLVDEMQRQIAEGDQAIVHIATHGQFDSDHTKSFLLAYDDKLTMDRLQATIASRQYQEEPLELLVLSACQTAAGDDRAALGLAGVALKAGARSALATLWFVNDESTARMVTDFYRNLGEGGNSKAQALQRAQIALIADRRFAHPSYWAPFLLIGNWL